jgi:hypothetical protein
MQLKSLKTHTMVKTQESFQDFNNPKIEIFTISLSLIIFLASVAFLVESII